MHVGLPPLPAPRPEERRGGALTTVGKRHLDEVVAEPGLAPALGERGRRLIGGVRAAQLVGGDDDPHPRRTVSRGALGSILGIAGDDYIWEPTAETLEHARATAFMRAHGIADWRELIRRSQDDVEWFWDAAVRFLDLEFFKPYDRVLDTSRGIAWATWFTGGTVNLTHNCVDRHPADQPAVVWESEDGQVVRATYGELAAETNRLANALLELGVGRGDAVGLFLPMSIQAVAAFYAVCKIGGIVVPIFSGFAAPAVAARLADAGAVALLTADAVPRRGRPVSMKAIADDAVAEAPTVRHIVVWERLGAEVPMVAGRDHRWDELVGRQSPDLDAPALDSETPMMVIYTSGTTGRPKGAVHVHGGLLVKIAEEAAFQADVHADDRVMWVTDMGWIMGPWVVVGAGAAGATLVVSEGAPDYPGPGRLWELVERHRISVLGVSPTLIRALRSHGDDHVRDHDRSSIRILASTGEPWNPDPYMWLHDVVGEGRAPIINLSGGTEIGACFLSPMPVMPLKSCTLGGPALGMAIDVAGPDGEHLPAGEVGELVCRKPWPSMTRGVWGDPQRYLDVVLVAMAGRVGARRLGVGRRGRLLVSPRPLRRHAERRRKEDRPRGVRVGGRVARRRRGGVRGGHPRPREGRGRVGLLRAAAGRRADRRAPRRRSRPDHRGARKGVRARRRAVRRRPPQDADRQDRPAGGAGGGAGRGSRRPVVARESLRAGRPGGLTVMDVDAAVRSRRTHKAYRPEPVDAETLDQLLDLARWAPNHHLTNPWRFRVIGPESLERLKAVADAAKPGSARKLDRAPTLVVVSARQTGDPVQDREDFLASGVAAYIVLLAAHARGLAGLLAHAHAARRARGPRRRSGSTPTRSAVGLIHLGWALHPPQPSEREPLESVVTRLD